MATILERIEALRKAEDILGKDIMDYITDKRIDVDVRWNVFYKSNLGNCQPYIESFDCLIGKEIADECEERYRSNCVFQELEYYEENLDPSEDHSVEINIYKENVMSSFTKEWINDW